MDASIRTKISIVLAVVAISYSANGASYSTRNFVVTAPTSNVAEEVGKAAEVYRRELAIYWLGQPLPNWSAPCKLKVRPGAIGAGGETTFQFVRGEVVNWNMYVQGSLERILDSVLPHEVNHTIFACHFRRPLPRWADEGAATLFEHRSEQMHQLDLLRQIIRSDREFLPLPKLLNMKQYPRGRRPMLILYAEGYALADFLVQQKGRFQYLKFLTDGDRLGWDQAIRKNYDHGGVESLQHNWKAWVVAGMPKLDLPEGQMVADGGSSQPQGAARPPILSASRSQPTIRSQSPDSGDQSTTFNRTNESQQGNSEASLPVFVEVVPNDEVADRDRSDVRTMAGQPDDQITGRRASFEAPEPRFHRPSGRQVHRPAGDVNTNNDQRKPRSVGPRFESTTHRSEMENASDQNISGMHLPQEHIMEAGLTPQWAGFPGQKKFF